MVVLYLKPHLAWSGWTCIWWWPCEPSGLRPSGLVFLLYSHWPPLLISVFPKPLIISSPVPHPDRQDRSGIGFFIIVILLPNFSPPSPTPFPHTHTHNLFLKFHHFWRREGSADGLIGMVIPKRQARTSPTSQWSLIPNNFLRHSIYFIVYYLHVISIISTPQKQLKLKLACLCLFVYLTLLFKKRIKISVFLIQIP